MSYQTGVSSTLPDLLSALFSFLEDDGFEIGPSWVFTNTVDFPYTNQWDVRTLRAPSGIYFTFGVPRQGTTYLWLSTAESLIEGAWLNQQQGSAPNPCRVDNLQGPHVGYHFFSDGLSVNVAVEIVTAVFVHFNFGCLQKNGDWVGGEYVTGLSIYATDQNSLRQGIGSYFNVWPFDSIAGVGNLMSYANETCGHVRTPISGPTQPISRSTPTPSTTRAYTTPWANNAGRPLLDYSPNKFNGRAVLVPINFVQASAGDSDPYYQLGTVGNARAVNIANLNAKETVNNEWMVFPVSQKNGPGTTYINSLNYGLAYKK